MSKNSKFLFTVGIGFVALFLGAFVAFLLFFGFLTKDVAMQVHKFGSVQVNDRQVGKFFDDMNVQINELIKETQADHPGFNFEKKLVFSNSATMRTEETPNEYKISVNLKNLGGDENNVKFDIKGNQVTVSAKYEKKKDDKVLSSSSFYQSFTLAEKIDSSKISRVRNGDELVITIPKSAQSKETQKSKTPQELYRELLLKKGDFI